MAGYIGGRSPAFDYIQPDEPANPNDSETWFDTDGGPDGGGETKVYDATNAEWDVFGFTSHSELADVTRAAHHPPVSVSGPLTQPADQSLGLSVGSGLGVSGGSLEIPNGGISKPMLSFAVVPSGVITMWSGSATSVPVGWTLCDGTDGTPDLRDRFIVGAGGAYASGDTGGTDEVQLTESEIPSHNHSGSTDTDGAHSHTYDQFGGGSSTSEADGSITGGYTSRSTSTDGDHSHTLTTDTAGGDGAHENRPPFLSLAFIMKT